MVTETGGKGGFERREGSALFGNARDKDGISEAKGSFEWVGNISLGRDIHLDKLCRETIGMDSVIEALRGEMVETLLLIATKCTKRDTVMVSPRLNVSKQGSKITTLYTRLSGDLARRQDG
jgi:hypothetical protein